MQFYLKNSNEVLKEVKSNENGLTSDEAKSRLEANGKNKLQEPPKDSLFKKFIKSLADPMIIMLLVAAFISAGTTIYSNVVTGANESYADLFIILFVVILNTILSVVQESKAENAISALMEMTKATSKVIRDGQIQIIKSEDLVVGDVIVLEAGDAIPADCRILESHSLKVEEAAITGESVPVNKIADILMLSETSREVPLGDRTNMLYSGSTIVYGRGKAVIVSTGMDTEMGKIADALAQTDSQETPLQKKLNSLGKTLGMAALTICAVIFVIGLLQGKSVVGMFMTAVSLAVAAIPEGLVAVSTIVLAIGVQKMVKRNAIVKRLPAVETLGSSTVICSDKTGTLTQNKMTVEKIFWNDAIRDAENISEDEIDRELEKLVYANMLCNDTKISKDGTLTGDPTETALVDMAFNLNFDPSIYDRATRVQEIPFDSERKLMTTVNKKNGKYIVYTKGGVDELLKCCNSFLYKGEVRTSINNYAKWIRENNEKMAKDALRVLAFAYKELDHMPSKTEMKTIESDLTFIGMVGMIDPPRIEAKKAVEKCKKAGIKTVMITGDHKITAVAIAKKLGILKDESEALTGTELEKMTDEELTKNVRKYSVYARVSPEHKVRIVKAWQANGEVVAMTGDGVNDSPALKTADIGCAMGKVGTEVAKEAADVILTDDNFATIVSAVEEGRRIYDNILKVIQFLLSCNVGEVIVLLLATLFAPQIGQWFGISDITMIQVLLPIHILWINLVTDTFPALALAFDPANKDIMDRKPVKRNEGIFTKGRTFRIIYQGLMIGLLTLSAYLIGLGTTHTAIDGLTLEQTKIEVGQTMAFIVLAFSELIHVFNIRDNKNSIFKTGILGNGVLILAILASALLMVVILFIPQLRTIFSIPILPSDNIIETIVLVLSPIVIVEIMKLFKVNTTRDE